MLSLELQEAFRSFSWVGNIRELQNVIESAMNMVSDEHVVGKEHLPAHVDLFQSRFQPPEPQPRHPHFSGDLSAHLDAVERELIAEHVAKAGGNTTRAARLLGISRQSLQYKMKRFGIEG